MYIHWSFISFGSILVLAAAWYGYTSLLGSDATSVFPLQSTSSHYDSYQLSDCSSTSCRCRCLVPMTARAEAVLRKIHARSMILKQRADVDSSEVPDLTQLTDQELKELLGLTDQVQVSDEQIQELRKLINSGDISFDVLKQIGEELSKNNMDYQDQLPSGIETDPVSPEGGEIMKPEEMEEVDYEDIRDEFIPGTSFSSSNLAAAVEEDDKDNGITPERPAAANENFGGVQDPFVDIAPEKTGFATLNNPFPSQPFPPKYVDLSHGVLPSGPGYDHSQSYIHPVRTFKFRLFVPTFAELFGFQLASQTIIELYVAKQPGPRERTGIPEAFYEQKYWNILMEVDGNKVISTLPSPVHADESKERTSSFKKRSAVVHEEQTSSGSIPIHHMQSGGTRSTRLPPKPLFDEHTEEDLKRFTERQRLKDLARNSYKERMSVQRYRKWLKEVLT